MTLQHDYSALGPAGVALTLPKGTILQESTPHGAATLGKVNGREYILIFHSDDSTFTPHSLEENKGWMEPYRFDVTK